jgi:hypothetical protein
VILFCNYKIFFSTLNLYKSVTQIEISKKASQICKKVTIIFKLKLEVILLIYSQKICKWVRHEMVTKLVFKAIEDLFIVTDNKPFFFLV